MPSSLSGLDYGIRSWILSALGFSVFAWGIRDLSSGLRLSKKDYKAFSYYSIENTPTADEPLHGIKS
jgi:hypothetical protein